MFRSMILASLGLSSVAGHNIHPTKDEIERATPLQKDVWHRMENHRLEHCEAHFEPFSVLYSRPAPILASTCLPHRAQKVCRPLASTRRLSR